MKEKMIRIVRSMRFRVFCILIVVGLVPIITMQSGILENYETQAIYQRAAMIRSQCSMISTELIDVDYLNGAESETIDSELKHLGQLYGDGRVIIVNGDFKIVHDTYDNIDQGKVVVARELIECIQGSDKDYYTGTDDYIEVISPILSRKDKSVIGAFITSVSTADIKDGKEKLGSTVFTLEVVLIIFTIAAALYASNILVRPFGKVTALLENSEGDFLEDDISMPDFTETKILAEAYNQMRARLAAQEESRQEFVSNVSHELKTPMTSMKVLSDSLIQQGDVGEVPNQLYREFMVDIGAEIDRENKIINDLLELVKMDRSSPDIHIEETNINDLVNLILKRLRPIGSKRGIELVLDSYKPIIADVDRTMMTLAISNLVENGIKYNKENGWVHVTLNSDSAYFFIKVEDSGIGIPKKDQERVFERFYRVDKSHSREIGGTGLGLAITKSAIQMHHGQIRVYSQEGEGTTFTVRVPLRYTPDESQKKAAKKEEKGEGSRA